MPDCNAALGSKFLGIWSLDKSYSKKHQREENDPV